MQLPNSGGEKKFLPPAKIDGERDRMSNVAFSLILYPAQGDILESRRFHTTKVYNGWSTTWGKLDES